MTFHDADFLPRKPGRISLVGAGPGAADLLTLRAMRCLGRADLVCYDRLVDPEVLALARPGARLVYTGKEVGAHSWPQDRINALIVAAALDGLHVVRLKSGDPSIFGRAAEEIDAARAHGIEVEVIPGITAASAAAASLCLPLTERGVTDRLVLATATCQPGETASDLADFARPGTTVALYMAMQQLDHLAARLRAAGLGPDHPVTVAAHVEKPGQTVLHTMVGTLARDCAAAGVRSPAILLVSVPKTLAPAPEARPIPAMALPEQA